MTEQAISMDAADDNLDGAIRCLLTAMRHNCGLLTAALRAYPCDSPERWKVFREIVPRYSEPQRSLIAYAIAEGRALKQFAIFSSIIETLTQSWDALISAYPESKDASSDRWNAACYRLTVTAQIVQIVYEHFGGKI